MVHGLNIESLGREWPRIKDVLTMRLRRYRRALVTVLSQTSLKL